jgi:hypothetical protein
VILSMSDLNPCARLAALLRADRVPYPERVAITATEYIAHELHQQCGHSESTEWLLTASDLYRSLVYEP